ncbi:hypothetical protein [Absidia glauca]|uniref:Uncharacterized protein n=1 Tax=Absidia glauca TaxID=4829 RepID=A0A163KNP8_ABSGL|nr:hypothetical protein [Absidia glauca]
MNLASLYTTIRHYLVVEHHYSTSLTDLSVAWSMTQRQECVCILLGGTSGCGKSTLASLLAHRMGITTVLSTDHVRSLLRSFDPEKTQPILWASSYQATVPPKEEDATNGDNEEPTTTINNPTTVTNQVIQGYETQNQLLLATLDKMIYGFYQRKESLVIEGVALSIETMRTLIQKHQHCIPLLIYISNEQKHMERFAIRAKYMTVAPKANKYIHYFDNIRLIQRHLCKAADSLKIPKINNTNVDRSLAIVHTTVINVLSQMKRTGQTSLLDPSSPDLLHHEFSKVYDATWSSKQMLRRIRENSNRNSTTMSLPQSKVAMATTTSHSSPRQHHRRSVSTTSSKSSKRRLSRKSLKQSDSSFTSELEHLDDTAWGSLAS